MAFCSVQVVSRKPGVGEAVGPPVQQWKNTTRKIIFDI